MGVVIAGGGSGWNLSGASGCGCKEVYKFPHITASIYTFFIFFNVFHSCITQYSSTVYIGIAMVYYH